MITVKCDKCPKTFTHPTQSKANQALNLHKARIHGRMKARGKVKDQVADKRQDSEASACHAKFCPECGFDLHMLDKAMGFASRVRLRR